MQRQPPAYDDHELNQLLSEIEGLNARIEALEGSFFGDVKKKAAAAAAAVTKKAKQAAHAVHEHIKERHLTAEDIDHCIRQHATVTSSALDSDPETWAFTFHGQPGSVTHDKDAATAEFSCGTVKQTVSTYKALEVAFTLAKQNKDIAQIQGYSRAILRQQASLRDDPF
jgi:hypothetical protein